MINILRTYKTFNDSKTYYRWTINKETMPEKDVIKNYKLSAPFYKDYTNMIIGVKPSYILTYNEIVNTLLNNTIYFEDAIIFFEDEKDEEKAFETIKRDLMNKGFNENKFINF